MSPATAPFEGWDPALPAGFRVPLAAMELEGATQRSIDSARCLGGWLPSHRHVGRDWGQVVT